ncbi:hypothetical protein FRC10_004484, partial [Ceratobasidium sp. 414]
MTDNPGRQKDNGNIPPDESKVRTLRGTSFKVFATRVFLNFAAPMPSPGPSARPSLFEAFNPPQSRPGSLLHDNRPLMISRTSLPGEDSDDLISEFTQDVVVPSSVPGEVTLNPDAVQAPSGTPKRARSTSMPAALSPPSSLSSLTASPVAMEPSAPVGVATTLSPSPPEGDFTFQAPVIISGPDNVRVFPGFSPITPTEPPSGQVALEAPATHSTEDTLTQPPTSEEAVMMEYVTPEPEPRLSPITEILLPHDEDMDLITDLMLPESAHPPSHAARAVSPVSRSVSQIPKLPTAIKDVPTTLPGQPGRENVHTNIVLSCIVKAGGRAQLALQGESTIKSALEILYRALNDGKEGLKAIADTVIASGDMEMYKKTAVVHHTYHCIINTVLSDLDDITMRDVEAKIPTKPIPTDMFAILKSLKEMQDENEMNAEILWAEVAELKLSFAALRADVPNTPSLPLRLADTPATGPKDATGPKSTPGPKSTTWPQEHHRHQEHRQPQEHQPEDNYTTLCTCPRLSRKTPAATPAHAPKAKPKTVTIQVGSAGPSSVPKPAPDTTTIPTILDWSDDMDLDKDKHTCGSGLVNAADFFFGDSGPIDVPELPDLPDEEQVQNNENDRFQTVDKGKGKAHGGPPPVCSFAQAAKIAANSIPNPKIPVPSAAKIVSDIHAMGRNDAPVHFAGTSKSNPEDYVHMTNPMMYRLVNDIFVRCSTQPRITHVGWNPKGNIILNFPANSAIPLIREALPDITKALSLPKDMTYTRCSNWSKVALGR